MDDLDFQIVEGLYNGAIHYTDKLFAGFYEWMRDRLPHTMLALTADHGESFGEHGLLGHGQCVYDTVTRVPLFLWRPGLVPSGVELQPTIQTIDLMPTVLELAGLEVPCIDGPSGNWRRTAPDSRARSAPITTLRKGRGRES